MSFNLLPKFWIMKSNLFQQGFLRPSLSGISSKEHHLGALPMKEMHYPPSKNNSRTEVGALLEPI